MRANLLLGFSLRAILIASLHIRRKSSKREASSSEATYLNRIALTGRTSFYVRQLFNRHELKPIVKRYKRRWGIETSYREHNVFLAKTTSKDYAVRMLYYAQ